MTEKEYYDVSKNQMSYYGHPIKEFLIDYDSHRVLRTYAMLKILDREKGAIYLLQKRPHDNNKLHVILLGVANVDCLSTILMTHRFPPPSPNPVKTTTEADRKYVSHGDSWTHMLAYWVWDSNLRDCYETSIDSTSWSNDVFIRQAAKPGQRSKRENIIQLGSGKETKEAFTELLKSHKPLLSVYTPLLPPRPPFRVYEEVAWAGAANAVWRIPPDE